MKIAIEPLALETLHEIMKYVESRNTSGAGKRWLQRFKMHIKGYARPKVKYTLCQNADLADMMYSCIIYGKWVVAFKIENNQFIIYEIINGSWLL